MCGIVGICHRQGRPVADSLLKRMTDKIAHRGPDSEGHFVAGNVGLGHRRLAILDLSPLGHQPMANENADVVIIFNGEIYNFQNLRVELEAHGHGFRSRTDTEVILHAYEEWGERCVERFNGMFAFAIWDKARRRLFLARDKYGVKPLYWWLRDGVFVFASEIKAILEHPAVTRAVDRAALNEYFTFQNVVSDRTLFDGVRLMPPATTMTIDVDGSAPPVTRKYWDYPFRNEPMSQAEAIERLDRLFAQAVTRQLVSDVPVGAYLSGGMDSGSITAVAARSVECLTTFTGGFDLSSASGLELGFDERKSAEFMANRFKTEHYEVVLHAGDMERILPKLIWHIDDLRIGQCYPNYYVARLAGKFVKVVLSGAGGDELFAGYPWRYRYGLGSPSVEAFHRNYYGFWQRLVPDVEKARFFNETTRREMAGHSAFDEFRNVFAGYPAPCKTNEEMVNACLYFELKTFLHGLLVIEDKVSMAHSLESRVPFLDDDLVEFACGVPLSLKIENLAAAGAAAGNENLFGIKHREELTKHSDGKAILRAAMARLIPPEVSARAKQGFSAPDASWFRGESIDYINRLLRSPKARIYDYLSPEYVNEALDQHCSGTSNRRLLIWSLLSFEWWLKNFFD